MDESKRHRNDGIRKRCDCPRRSWGKCPHDWHFSFKWGETHWRFSLDVEIGSRIQSKDKAREHADSLRSEIRAGTFVRVKDRAKTAPAAQPDGLTFTAYGAIFHAQCPKLRGKNKGKARDEHDASMLRTLQAAPGADAQPLGPRPVGSITQADVEAAIASLRGRGRSASHLNKLRVLIALLGRWGAKKGYLSRTWIVEVDAESSLGRDRGAKRDRRVETAERESLMRHASPFLQRLIVAAVQTCNREGEVLNLQWADVSLTRMEFTVRDTKNGKARTLPISPALKALLEMLRDDPAGQRRPADHYVFGNAIGGKATFPRKTWEATVLRAHGITPEWSHNHKLTSACRAELRRINLHFHDLRHEGASLLLEGGWPLHHIQLMLGHATLAQTAEYLNVARMGLQDSMRRFGTLPTPGLHSVAPEAEAEQPPPCNEPRPNGGTVVVN
jgi:integrase